MTKKKQEATCNFPCEICFRKQKIESVKTFPSTLTSYSSYSPFFFCNSLFLTHCALKINKKKILSLFCDFIKALSAKHRNNRPPPSQEVEITEAEPSRTPEDSVCSIEGPTDTGGEASGISGSKQHQPMQVTHLQEKPNLDLQRPIRDLVYL